jgi:hypothetical protein
MESTRSSRRFAIALCGALVAGMSAFMPAAAEAGGPCQVPWLEHCISTTANCVDCNQWCKTHVATNCVEEWTACEVDTETCPSPNLPVDDSCTCKPGTEDR